MMAEVGQKMTTAKVEGPRKVEVVEAVTKAAAAAEVQMATAAVQTAEVEGVGAHWKVVEVVEAPWKEAEGVEVRL